MEFVLASGNAHKAVEIGQMLPDGIAVTSQGSLGIGSVPETGQTFIENALIKARHAAAESGRAAIADDSGIAVRALGGEPGIYSARYAGENATDEDNVNKLLDGMSSLSGAERQASFHCVLVCLRTADDPTPLIAEGSWSGSIAVRTSGTGGFGYDPVFVADGYDCTVAELSTEEKNRLSHRAIALRKLSALILEHYTD